MRRLAAALVAVLVVSAGCTGASEPDVRPTPVETSEPAISLASLGLDWPRADGMLDVADPPEAPDGFAAALVARMADVLTDWAQVSTVDEDVRRSATPVQDVAAALPPESGAALRALTEDAVSPDLGVANVFADDVTLLGAPVVTTAWDVSTRTDDAGRPYVLLQLQTRAAYEVRLGDDAPTRVIGVLRVHGLSAYPGTTDDFGVTGGWQEFGAGDCALALDDALLPDADLDAAARDLRTFVEVGDGSRLVMPPLEDDDQVDAEYLQRCRDGAT